ncbi:MAG: DNA topoisomerase, partial [Parasporobacterium sp.]|nr:DNA topoisomerase [Parasporobacterium sp.]
SNESDKNGIRIVLELKKGADPVKLENMLYKKTKLEDTLGVNMLAIADGKPEVLSLKDIFRHSVNFQYEINTRKYNTLLAKDLEQREIKEGLIKACDIIDLIIEIIRGSQNITMAKGCLTEGKTEGIKFRTKGAEKEAAELRFTEKQAQAILDLRLSKLIGLEILQLKKEYEELVKEIARFEKILSDKKAMTKVIISELEAIKKEYDTERRTEIIDGDAAVFEEEAVKEQEVVVLMDRFGYTKAVETQAYERNAETLDAENKYVIRCMNTDRLCIFTDKGTLHQVRVMKLPVKKPKDKGVPIDNLCKFESANENIIHISSLKHLLLHKMLFTTAKGMMKFVDSSEFDVSKQMVAATKLMDGDTLTSIELFDNSNKKVYKDFPEEELNIAISGGSDMDDMLMGDDPISMFTEADDQLTFDFFDLSDGTSEEVTFSMDDEPSAPQEASKDSSKAESESTFQTNKMAVLQTKDGVFIRFRLNEVPEKKKGAVGVRAIKLAKDDEVDKVYIVGFGDKTSITYRDKEVELMKLKLSKRDTKGTKLRG